MLCTLLSSIIHSLIHLFRKYLIVPNHMLGSIPGSEITREKRLCSQTASRLVRHRDEQSQGQVVNATLRRAYAIGGGREKRSARVYRAQEKAPKGRPGDQTCRTSHILTRGGER